MNEAPCCWSRHRCERTFPAVSDMVWIELRDMNGSSGDGRVAMLKRQGGIVVGIQSR